VKEPEPRIQAITDFMKTVFKVVSGSGGPRLGGLLRKGSYGIRKPKQTLKGLRQRLIRLVPRADGGRQGGVEQRLSC